ncbi:hypothetical protein AB0I84_41680 [Streptomyces spectabilis]|uniref:deoxynucleotide monophosphate kinase family protein n=1 Tax=Streptomyces spectabilis TaxID=68270 RepID=UPI0033DB6FC5
MGIEGSDVDNIGIMGRAGTGKDTVGGWFVEHRGYRRVAFADPLKEAALKADPVIEGPYPRYPLGWTVRLSVLVEHVGWERAKDEYPDVRRFLQGLGGAVRAIDEDFWLRTAVKRVVEENERGRPVVITDVRYPNEAASLKRAGFQLLHIDRPGIPHLTHESESALGPEDAHLLVCNDGTRDDLYAHLAAICDEVAALSDARRALTDS